MVSFSEHEGMLIADTILSHDEAIEVLKGLLSQTKGNQSYAAALKAEVEKFYADYLKSEVRTHTLKDKKVQQTHWFASGTDEISTIEKLYKRWEQLANEWLGIMQTQAMFISMNEDTSEINQVYYGAEELFLAGSTSAEASALSAKKLKNTALFGNTDKKWASQDKEWQAKYENAVRKVLSQHYKKMVQELKTERPDAEELAVALSAIPEKKQATTRQRIHIVKNELEKGSWIPPFDWVAFGKLAEASKYGRYSEMFVKHMMRGKHVKTLTAEAGVAFEKSLDGSVWVEEQPNFLTLAVTSLDNDRYTAGGDIIIKMGNGTSFSIQLKTANNALSGGNPVSASVIADTCQAWIKALSLSDVKDQAEALWKAQSTQVFVEETKKGISNMTQKELNALVDTLFDKDKTLITVKDTNKV